MNRDTTLIEVEIKQAQSTGEPQPHSRTAAVQPESQSSEEDILCSAKPALLKWWYVDLTRGCPKHKCAYTTFHRKTTMLSRDRHFISHNPSLKPERMETAGSLLHRNNRAPHTSPWREVRAWRRQRQRCLTARSRPQGE